MGRYVLEKRTRNYPLPPARNADSGRVRSLSIAIVPISGPTTSGANAHCQPTARCTTGTSWIDPIVTRNPTAVWSVSADPT